MSKHNKDKKEPENKTRKKSFTIHDLPISERPRERLLKFGSEALSAQEILALILGRGIGGESVMVTAQRLLSGFGSLKGIANASVEELSKVKGIGVAKAAQIKASFEFGKRVEESYLYEKNEKVIRTPEDVVNLVKTRLRGKKKEHFLSLLLDTRNRLIAISEISVGSLDTSIVHPREVFKEAISASASSCIFIHNHPSGDPTPSRDDIELTKRLIEAGKIIGIEIRDHIVITDKDFISLKGRGDI
jgi:DNA repair protein RadC